MKLNTTRTSPDLYIRFGGNEEKQLSYRDNFKIEPNSGQTPWVPSRFGQPDLLKRISNRRLNLNNLNFVPEGPDGQAYEMFPGGGRFNEPEDYDLSIGRPKTPNFPEQQPDFNPGWLNMYSLSPVIAPGDKIKNPFPRLGDLDPNGYLAAMAEEGTNSSIPNFPDLINENAQAKVSIG